MTAHVHTSEKKIAQKIDKTEQTLRKKISQTEQPAEQKIEQTKQELGPGICRTQTIAAGASSVILDTQRNLLSCKWVLKATLHVLRVVVERVA